MEAVIGGVVVGAVVAIAAPTVVTGIGEVVRPLAKEIIKGGIVGFTAVSEMFSEAGESFNDIVAEVKAEMDQPKAG